MRKKYASIIIVFFLVLICTRVFAQQNEKLVQFSQGNFTTGSNIYKQQFKKENIRASFFGDRYFVLIQFSAIPSIQLQDQLKEQGIELGAYISGDAYLATIKGMFDFTLAGKYTITSINTVPATYKIDQKVTELAPTFDKQAIRAIGVSYYPTMDKATVKTTLQSLGASILTTRIEMPGVVFIQASQTAIDSIAVLPFVTYISVQTLKDKPLNYEDVAIHGASGFNEATGENLDGKGVTIGIGDQGSIVTHIDLSGRTITRLSSVPDPHSTHVAGTAAGAGIVDIINHGMATKATIIDQYFSDIISNAPAYIADNDLLYTNNSYADADAGCVGEGGYDFLSNYADAQAVNYDRLLHVFAAGNDGTVYTCGAFPTSFATVKSGWQSAKDVLTVGAMNSADYTIAWFSSLGPVADGRIKPEITTNGFNVLSTVLNNGYNFDHGTSMAAPVATGALALMCERYRQLHGGADPKSALMKAIICNTAEDLGNPGPDYTFGFGMLDVKRAVQAIDSNWYSLNSLANGTNAASTIYIPANARRLKVMLYWNDLAAAVNGAAALVNDLDLTVTTPAAVLHYPLVLNPAPANVLDNAVEGPDHTNNIEQVDIENPVAGTYTVNVNGYRVVYGSQPYAITYDIIDSSVTVNYPFGGETLVPGTIENLRWSGYGDESNTYTIQYSPDNGSSWSTVATGVSGATQTYPWTVPSTATNKALIKVSRDGTTLSGQSSFNFTVLGRPIVVDTVLCEGYVQLNWGAIANATSYDVMQLVGDSMQAIANTTDTFFIVKGLNKYQTYWLGVTAKNGAVSGRRSLSISAMPNGGACTLPAFNNDLKIDSILQPNTARRFFSTQGNATAPVKVRIKNIGSIDVTGPFTVSYNCAGGTATETVTATVPAGGTYDYTFTTPYTTTATGFHYIFQAWVTNAADSNHENDTAYKVVKLLANPAISILPVTESFETVTTEDYMNSVTGLDGDDALDFSSSTNRGRARPFINTGFSLSGKNAMTLDQTPYDVTNNTDSLTVTYNLSSFVSTPLRYDFFYSNQGVVYDTADKVWIRGSENNQWIPAYDLFGNQTVLGQYKHAQFSITALLESAVPAQKVSSTFQIRFGEVGLASANTPDPDNSTDNGYTFDSLTVNLATNDVALLKIVSPDKTGCGITTTTPIIVQLRNYSNTALTNVHVFYQINGGTIDNEVVFLPADTVINYTFSRLANLSSYTTYTINTWVKYSADTYNDNDSVLNYTIHNGPVITTYPYLESFESNNGYFYTDGTNSSWQWGLPQKPIINQAANGNYCWVTNLVGNYQDNEMSYLYSPCFDLSSLAHPMLSFSHIFQIEDGYDFTWVEYSTDGISWQKLGASGSGTNWYDNAVGQDWGASDTIWHAASISIPTNSNRVKFRFALSSDAAVTYAGVGIDDIHIFDSATIYTGSTITTNEQDVNGKNWIDFKSGGQLIASINPNGTNLGNTNVQVYPHVGNARHVNNHYYLNRSLVIQPTNEPLVGYVTVRLYYTDAEVNNLINANDTSCHTCNAPPGSAYKLGVTKFSGTASNENGTLNDNIGGYYLYIPRSGINIVPFNNGYYSEFNVANFSEFWMDSLGFNSTPLPLDLLSFTASKKVNEVLLNWNTADDSGVYQYVIQRSADGNNFSYLYLGTVPSNDTTSPSQYHFIDSLPLSGFNYYRLKIIDADGGITYSPVQEINFADEEDGVFINPNPVTDGNILITSLSNALTATLIDGSGKEMRSYQLEGKKNHLYLSGISKGIYMIKVITENSTITKTIIVN
ncbi:MAG TPA: S8 family serine peptidase [Ferruginibacter sp.]|nr:S8 family serine peptidase [Ferruginibacter sp.]